MPKLKAWLLEMFSCSRFNTSSAPLAKMIGNPIKIHINTQAEPIAIHKPILIPHHWQEEVKKQLDKDEELGIIEKVPVRVPT